jgi:hypothetical protein
LRVTFSKSVSGGGAPVGAASADVVRGRTRRPETTVVATLQRVNLRTVHLLLSLSWEVARSLANVAM